MIGAIDLAPEEGEVRANEPLSRHTTLRIGGLAEHFVAAHSTTGLAKTLAAARRGGQPLWILGKGSNVLVSDDGLPGVVVTLAGEFQQVAIEGDRIVAGGGAMLGGVCAAAARAGLSGIEAISGIPSSVGGAVRINAGAYGSEIFDVLEEVRLVSREGHVRDRPGVEIPHGYRWSELVETGEIVARATLALRRVFREEIEEKMREVASRRRGALPSEPNAGSVFKNPEGEYAGRLIEECGLKGTRSGGAEISTRHANVIVNRGGARAEDVLDLMRKMRDAVREKFGIELSPEVELLGLRWP